MKKVIIALFNGYFTLSLIGIGLAYVASMVRDGRVKTAKDTYKAMCKDLEYASYIINIAITK